MKWAILIYAVLTSSTGIPDKEQFVVSWNIPFTTHEECAKFYKANEKNLQDGVKLHGARNYNLADVKEMGCVRAELNPLTWKPGDLPSKLIDKVILFQRDLAL